MNAIVAQIQRRWAAAFARADADALASLYIEGALFFGSMPDLYCGRSADAAPAAPRCSATSWSM